MSNSFLGDLLEMDDEEVFKLVDEQYGLSERQEALNGIIGKMIIQLEKLKKREKNMVTEIAELREENDRLHNIISKKSKYLTQIFTFIFSNIEF